MRVVLVDDEKHALLNLEQAIHKKCPGISIQGSFQDPVQAVDFIKENEIDIVFLDVDMPKMDGFRFLNQFKDQQFEVIFTTAYDKYAVQAFRVSAVDYLLKPIDQELLPEAIKKARERLESGISGELYSFLKQQMESATRNQIKKIAISSSESIHFINLSDIIYCQGESNYSRIIQQKNPDILATRTLKDMEVILPEEVFFRVHKSYIINCDMVDSYMKTDGGYLLMEEGSRIPVARSRKNELLQRLTTG